jgi:TolB-like protein/Flp pilus assembly protein TadD
VRDKQATDPAACHGDVRCDRLVYSLQTSEHDRGGNSPSEREVQDCLEKVLSSPGFVRSWSISRLLRFLVSQALGGAAAPVKEYTLGVEVFERGDDFDPNADNIVRVQARNLRTRLQEYYAAQGSHDSIRIEFPKGSYQVQFQSVTPAPAKEPERSFRLWIAGVAIVVTLVAAGIIVWRLRTAPSDKGSGPRVVAVLPFTNLDRNPDSDYFSDGLAEELINSLSKLEGLSVIARSSSFRFRGAERDVKQIAQELKATDFVEGSVRKRGAQIRVAVHLVDVATGQTIWSGQYDRDLNDAVRTEEEIAYGVAATLKLRLSAGRVNSPNATNQEAYDLYLKGRYYWNKIDPADAGKAIALFEQAIRTDPSYAPPYVGLAAAYGTQTVLNLVPPRENWPRTKAMLIRALELDEANAEAHTLSGGVAAWYEWDYERSEVEYRRGVELGPGSVIAHQYFASMLGAMGRAREADEEMDKALRLDPLNNFAKWAKAQLLYWKGDMAGARSILAELYRRNPELPYVSEWLGFVHSLTGEHGQAIRVLEEAVKRSPGNPNLYGSLGYIYGKAGQPEKARAVLANLELMGRSRYVAATNQSSVYLGLGDHRMALQYLAQACEERAIRPPWILVDPRFRELRNEPGFDKLVAHVNLAGKIARK